MKSNGLIALAVSLSFIVGRFSVAAGFDSKKWWVEALLFFILWLFISASLLAHQDIDTQKEEPKTKKKN